MMYTWHQNTLMNSPSIMLLAGIGAHCLRHHSEDPQSRTSEMLHLIFTYLLQFYSRLVCWCWLNLNC